MGSLPVKTISCIPPYSLLPPCTPTAAEFWHTPDPSSELTSLANLAKS